MTATPAQVIVDAARRMLGLAPIHRHQYKQLHKWCFIDGNLVLEKWDRCGCGDTTNRRFLLIASADNLAEAESRRDLYTTGGQQ